MTTEWEGPLGFYSTTGPSRDEIIEECAKVIDRLLAEDEATAQAASIAAGYATAGYRNALREAAEALRALKGKPHS